MRKNQIQIDNCQETIIVYWSFQYLFRQLIDDLKNID
jgi:hypothetical protein